MPVPNLFLFYVADVDTSVAFYRDLLARDPKEHHPTFAAFDLGNGTTLGLWTAAAAVPPPAAVGEHGELGFALADGAAVEAAWRDWQARGLPIAQPLTRLDFGPTFVARDPDGHRLRVFATG